ncbi:MAG: formamidopyrimidine-DNA glycosylase, partial [Acidobacteria bacterium]|nr:formamidopyrimidine-DNA glycosylase [Acidobacteriota bacterium]
MPELPDVELYLHALRSHVGGSVLERVRLASSFLLRSVTPPLSAAAGREVAGFRRLGKRIVFELEGELFLVLHLMIAGRLRWKEAGCKIPRRLGLAAVDFAHGSLLLTEAGSKKRASLYVVAGEEGLADHDPGGLEILDAEAELFTRTLRAHSHTLKRALTDPRIFSGIGNAYSDEILHRARLSPFKRTQQLSDEEAARLFAATVATLTEWRDRLIEEVGDAFPDKVTAFRPGMAVHGRYNEDCPECGTPVQRILYAENEANYCVECQTGGKLLADRVLSRLLKDDWPQ